MYDTQMNRIASRVTFGRDYHDTPVTPDTITSVPTAAEAAALFSKED